MVKFLQAYWNITLLKSRNKKLKFLLKKAEHKTTTKYSVPVIDLSKYHLKHIEYQQLKLGLDYSYIDKNKKHEEISCC